MTTKLIGIDIDDTICESFGPVARATSKRYNVNFSYEDITDYHFKNIKALEGIECDWLGLFKEAFTKEHHEFIPVPKSQEIIRELKAQGYSIAAITARWDGFIDITREWLDTHFSGLIDELHFLGSETGYNISKAETCKNL